MHEKSEPGGAEGALATFKQVGSALRLVREERGLSLARLAALSSSGKSQLSKYENGKELPKLDSLARVLDALDVEPLTLFYWASRLSRGVSLADIEEEMLHTEARRDAGSQPFNNLFNAALEAHMAYVKAGMGLRRPYSMEGVAARKKGNTELHRLFAKVETLPSETRDGVAKFLEVVLSLEHAPAGEIPG